MRLYGIMYAKSVRVLSENIIFLQSRIFMSTMQILKYYRGGEDLLLASILGVYQRHPHSINISSIKLLIPITNPKIFNLKIYRIKQTNNKKNTSQSHISRLDY